MLNNIRRGVLCPMILIVSLTFRFYLISSYFSYCHVQTLLLSYLPLAWLAAIVLSSASFVFVADYSAVICAPNKVTSHTWTSETENEQWVVYFGTECGRIYCFKHSELCILNKEKSSSTKANGDIFTDLLDAAEEATHSSPIPTSPTECVVSLTEEHVILNTKQPVINICVCGQNIITTTYKQKSIKVNCYIFCNGETSGNTLYPSSTYTFQSSSVACIGNLKLSVVTCDLINTTQHGIDNFTIRIASNLFTSSFGSEAALVNSPVILLMPPDGSVYWCPLKFQEVKGQDPSKFKLLLPTRNLIIGVRSASFILETSNKSDSSPLEPKTVNTVVFCSEHGECSGIVYTEEKNLHFITWVLPCAVLDFHIVGSSIYVTSGKDVMKMNVILREKNDDSCTSISAEVTKVISLKFSNAEQIVCVPDDTIVQENVILILCRTYAGHIKTINIEDRKSFPSVNIRQGGYIKDLLLSIDNCQSQLETLTTKQQTQKKFITQLNIASCLLSQTSVTHSQDLFLCKLNVTRLVIGGDLCLTCKLTNRCGLELSQDWSVVINVEQDLCRETSTFSSVRLSRGMKPGADVYVTVNLPTQFVRIPFHVNISLGLHFPEDDFSQVDRGYSRVLNLPIYSEAVDIFYFLNDEKFLSENVVQICESTNEMIREMARKRPAAVSLMEKRLGDWLIQEAPSSLSMLCDVAILQNTDLKKYGQGEESILKFLTQHTQNPASVSDNQVTLVDPTGQSVKLTVQKDAENVQITIATTDTTLGASVREAISRRLKKLLHDLPGHSEGTERIINAHHLQGDIEAVKSKMKSAMTTKDVIDLYRRLRTIRTPVVRK